MSTAEHYEAAAEEDRAANLHEGRQHPDPDRVTGCGSANAAERTGIWDICWSATVASAEEHDREAARRREAAAKHRAAAAALERAEAAACDRVSADDRDMSPFFHRQDIRSMSEIPATSAGLNSGLRGARVIFRRVDGLTKESLQALVDCHMARAASVGHVMPEMEYCPLVLKDVHASVTETEDGLALEITSEDRTVADTIVRRVRKAMIE